MKSWGKGLAVCTLGLALIGSAALPVSASGELDKLQQQLEEVKKQESAAKEKREETQDKIQTLSTQREEVNQQLKDLDEDIGKVEEEIRQVNGEIEQTGKELDAAKKALAEAEARVEERNELLKTRVRLMYMKGDISYLEVLFGAQSFTDFLDRLQAIQLIVHQDAEILAENKRDQEIIAAAKVEIEQHLATLGEKKQDAESLQAKLAREQEKKQVLLTQINADIDAMEDIQEQERARLMALAKKQSELTVNIRRVKEAARSVQVSRASGNGILAWPVPASYRITSEFGYRIHPISGVRRLHAGIDIGASTGSTVIAAESGVVLISGWYGGYGNTVVIDHGNGLWTLYGHNSRLNVRVGQYVKRGEKIAEVGSTGNSTGPHSHFEVTKNGALQNPRNYVN